MSIRSEAMSDSQSDCTGRGSSLGSREDLSELAASLGLTSAELSQDRFRVDRKRLEALIFGNENVPEAAQKFFDHVMQETKTHVTWPSRLKLGAKSKKDPHIRVIGRAENVKVAREKILASLDTRASRVNMKIDVSYTDHSHIIGKGGLTIRRVMEETGCHIHFPDSNRSNPTEKSNQVSIAGEVAGVEKARARVRELTPLIFCFELPILGALALSPDPSSPYIKSLQEQYNVQVMFRTRQKLNSTLVVVKGCEWEVARVKEATQLLISHMCDSLASQVSVHMMVEISPQHHSIVLGRNNENLKGIMQRTSTQIIFLDPTDPNIPSLKKSNVTITGSIHNVYIARQQLIGSLPIVLMFDVPENSVDIDTDLNSQIMSKFDVLITTRHKPKQNILSFIIKGIERNVNNVYEARRKLLSSNENPVEVNIPLSYFIPNPGPIFKSAWRTNNNDSVVYPNLSPPPIVPMLGRPDAWHPVMQFQLLPHISYHQPPILSPHSVHLDRLAQAHFSYSSLSLPDIPAVYSSLSSNTSTISSPSASPRTVSPVPHAATPDQSKTATLSNSNTETKAPGFDRPLLTPEEFQKMKLQALQAMQRPPRPSDVRNPNSIWSGYGFSQSNPNYSIHDQKNLEEEKLTQVEKSNWYPSSHYGLDLSTSNSCSPDIAFSSSNYFDSVSSATLSNLSNSSFKDLHTLLAVIGLEKYSRLFQSNEIDISTFRTLTDSDLKEIGITAFGARRKILLSIAELNRRQRSPFRGSAAPGAERRSSSTNSLDDKWS
ncbi:protein bicaudal C [Halyomorpha halys]|uniref:protein bicaudal C n=1 Tax=Halyomorpha halys TaxID=286706 RepID=UPI000D0C76E3|nr:protein bicaudal C homolog 1 [Halyomorpha halys]